MKKGDHVLPNKKKVWPKKSSKKGVKKKTSISVTLEKGPLGNKHRESVKQEGTPCYGKGGSRLQSWMKTGISDFQDNTPRLHAHITVCISNSKQRERCLLAFLSL